MYKHVLVPIAGDQSPTTESALKAARALAKPDGKISALTVLEAIPAMVELELPDGIIEENRKILLQTLKATVGEGVDAEVVTGHAARTINEYADTHDVDCIVIASHQPGLADYFLGSTANHVVRHAHCAVHVVR